MTRPWRDHGLTRPTGGMGCDFELARAFPVVVVRRPSTRAGERDARAAIRIARRDPRDLVTS